jgi:hypothetical protein
MGNAVGVWILAITIVMEVTASRVEGRSRLVIRFLLSEAGMESMSTE